MTSHDAGHHLFTIGQRARIGGHPVAWFVVGKDPVRNTVIVVCGREGGGREGRGGGEGRREGRGGGRGPADHPQVWVCAG